VNNDLSHKTIYLYIFKVQVEICIKLYYNEDMIIKREIQKELEELANSYPVVTITGPRQAGKTTLAKIQFPDYKYCNLEIPEIRKLAVNDPNALFSQFNCPLIIDEIQRVPELLSYIQAMVDEKNEKGMFILTGSQQLDLGQAIAQSLAGRTALLHLLPLSIQELKKHDIVYKKENYIYRGFLPRIYKDNLNPTKAYRNYFQTYIERDLRKIINIKNLSKFEIFMRLLAGRVGQVINFNSLSNDVGISSTTLSNWLSVLEASFIIFKLLPYYKNLGKRVIKSPKIYFTDIGLVTYLIGIEEKDQVFRDPLIGNLFENMVVIEAVKTRLNKGLDPNLFFYRDNNRNEIDLIYRKGPELTPIEIKSSETFNTDFCKNLNYFKRIYDHTDKAYLIYAGKLSTDSDFIKVLNFVDTYKIFN
jgi:predicted AAA+ superfamily ATPase